MDFWMIGWMNQCPSEPEEIQKSTLPTIHSSVPIRKPTPGLERPGFP
jgi:hypothetical protein